MLFPKGGLVKAEEFACSVWHMVCVYMPYTLRTLLAITKLGKDSSQDPGSNSVFADLHRQTYQKMGVQVCRRISGTQILPILS